MEHSQANPTQGRAAGPQDTDHQVNQLRCCIYNTNRLVYFALQIASPTAKRTKSKNGMQITEFTAQSI